MDYVLVNTLPHQFCYKNETKEYNLEPASKDIIDAFRATEKMIEIDEIGDKRVIITYSLNFDKIYKIIQDILTKNNTKNIHIFVSTIFANALHDEAVDNDYVTESGKITERAITTWFPNINIKISIPYTGPGYNKNGKPYVVRYTKEDFPDDTNNKLIGQIKYTTLLVYVI